MLITQDVNFGTDADLNVTTVKGTVKIVSMNSLFYLQNCSVLHVLYHA